MNRTNQILTVALIVQVILAVVLLVLPGDNSSNTRDSGPLLEGFDPSAVTAITITNDLDETLALARQGEAWVLPDAGDYPAQSATVNNLLSKLSTLSTDRPIATSTASHRQLGVASDEFQRRIEISQGGTTYRVYLGTPSGPGGTHVRLGNEDMVYLGQGLATWEATAQPASWAVTSYFTLPQEDVVRVTLENANGTFDFTRAADGSWDLDALDSDAAINTQAVLTLLGQITAVNLRRPLGTVEETDYAIGEPQATIVIRTRETLEVGDTPIEATYTLRVGAALEEGIVLKASNSPYYVLVPTTTVDPWINYTAADFAATGAPSVPGS